MITFVRWFVRLGSLMVIAMLWDVQPLLQSSTYRIVTLVNYTGFAIASIASCGALLLSFVRTPGASHDTRMKAVSNDDQAQMRRSAQSYEASEDRRARHD